MKMQVPTISVSDTILMNESVEEKIKRGKNKLLFQFLQFLMEMHNLIICLFSYAVSINIHYEGASPHGICL
jgi:hypothetical protein